MIGRRRCERGFTLIELVITIAIMGVIVLPLGNFVIAYFQNYTQTEARFSESHDMQIAAAYFSQDVANTGLRDASDQPQQSVWNATTGFPASYCGNGAGTPVLLLEWEDWTVSGGTGTPAGSPSAAAYVVESGTLHRLYCPSGSTASSDVTVVHNLVFPDSGNSTPATCQPTASSTASASACGTASPPAIVNLTLSIQAAGDSSIVLPRPMLTAQRRQS